MKKKMKMKKLIALYLTVIVLISGIPVEALAAGENGGEQVNVIEIPEAGKEIENEMLYETEEIAGDEENIADTEAEETEETETESEEAKKAETEETEETNAEPEAETEIETEKAEETEEYKSTKEFHYVQEFSEEGVKAVLTAEAGIVPDNASVHITLLKDNSLEKANAVIQRKMEEERSVFQMYSGLKASVERTYALDFEITYIDANGDVCTYEPAPDESVQVQLEIDGIKEKSAEEMCEIDLFHIPDEGIVTAADGKLNYAENGLELLTDGVTVNENTVCFETGHFSVYAVSIVKYAGTVSEEKIAAEEKAWNIIQTYADPDYFLDDPYRDEMTDEEYKELRNAALNAVSGCTTQYEKIKAITAYVADSIYYDFVYYYNNNETLYYAPYEVYAQKRTICGGYANLMRTLFISLGIPCMYLGGERHAYNAVYDSENRTWVFADATWCSKNTYTDKDVWNYRGYSYLCFDLTPQQIAELSSHEVYSIDGLLENNVYYRLQTSKDAATWSDCDWYLELTGAKGDSAEIACGSGFAGFEVTAIGKYDFRNCESLAEIDLSKSKISEIAEWNFYNCVSLKTVKFPGTLTEIGKYAFYKCKSLAEIDLAQTGVTEIGKWAFGECSSLKEVKLPNCLKQIGEIAFYRCEALQEADLSKTGVTEIPNWTFGYCTSLKEIKFPSTLTQLGEYAFYDCKALENELDLSKTKLETIGDMAFYYTLLLKAVRLPDTVKMIGKDAFSGSVRELLVVTSLSESQLGTEAFGGRKVVICPWLYTIQFEGNGAASGSMEKLLCGGNNKSTLPASQYKRSRYAFCGWNTKADGSGKAYADGAAVKNLTSKDGKTVKLYAQWKKNTYTITYHLNGGKNNKNNPASYRKTSDTITLKKPTRKGYTFAGWYSDKKLKHKVTKIASGSTGDKTFYAKWKKIKYTITYELNGGKNHKNNPGSYTVTTKTIKLAKPTRKGYVFKGWYQDKKCRKKITQIKKGSTGNVTLYAKWQKK